MTRIGGGSRARLGPRSGWGGSWGPSAALGRAPGPPVALGRMSIALPAACLQVNVPKTKKAFCKGKECRKHTMHKVTQYKTGKASLYAQGAPPPPAAARLQGPVEAQRDQRNGEQQPGGPWQRRGDCGGRCRWRPRPHSPRRAALPQASGVTTASSRATVARPSLCSTRRCAAAPRCSSAAAAPAAAWQLDRRGSSRPQQARSRSRAGERQQRAGSSSGGKWGLSESDSCAALAQRLDGAMELDAAAAAAATGAGRPARRMQRSLWSGLACRLAWRQ